MSRSTKDVVHKACRMRDGSPMTRCIANYYKLKKHERSFRWEKVTCDDCKLTKGLR